MPTGSEASALAELDSLEPAEWTDEPITDEELTALALAADLDAPLDDDAVPFDSDERQFGDLLPEWYMPAPAGGRRRRSHAVTAAVIVLSLLGVNAVGLCVTNGFLEIAW
ncbi:MAG: hypothetical protein ABIR32_07840 [Ilumatobacteraceae bacterium]